MESGTIVLFGVSGDLSPRMVMRAIFRLWRRGLPSLWFRLIGYAGTKLTDDEFREYEDKELQGFTELASRLAHVDGEAGAGAARVLSGDPTFFARADEAETASEILEPVIAKSELEKATDFPNYKAGPSGRHPNSLLSGEWQ